MRSLDTVVPQTEDRSDGAQGQTEHSGQRCDRSRPSCSRTIHHSQVYDAAAIRAVSPAPGDQSVLFGIDRHPPGEPTPGLRADPVALGNIVEDEAGTPDQVDGVPGEMAAVGQPALEGLQAVLPCRHARIGGNTVLEEVEPASRAKDPSDLRQGGVDVGNRAQGEGAQGVVAGVIG